MELRTAPLSPLRRRRGRRAAGRSARPAADAEPRAAASGQRAAQARAQRSGGPQDKALYACGCGYVFRALVTTSVGCPRCGTGQAW
jgi:hypothetical protein